MPMVAELPSPCLHAPGSASSILRYSADSAVRPVLTESSTPGSDYLITMDAYYRGGSLIDHKEKADTAVADAAKEGRKVKKVLDGSAILANIPAKTPMVEGRDVFVNDLLKKYYGVRIEPVPMPAEAPLFLMYTSGTTGKPKGCQHNTGGYLAYKAELPNMCRIYTLKTCTGVWLI